MKCVFIILFTLLAGCQTSSVIYATHDRENLSTIEASGHNFAIATQGKYATQAALDIFKQGGNIIDAAVAASFVVSVERPQSTGIGGGGFLLFRQKNGETFAVDFRERAPFKALKNMYVKNGKVTKDSQDGILAAGTPGLVAGLLEVHEKFGKLPLKIIMAPAIDLAQNGFPIYNKLYDAVKAIVEVLKKDPESSKIFLTTDKNPLPLNHILIQKDLANTLALIAENGRKEFYSGSTAKKITAFMVHEKGLLTAKDLNSYQVKWRKPLKAAYKDFEILSMPPPSSGGIHVIQFLKFLENDNLKQEKPLSSYSIHLAASALQSAFADRAKYLGDPDFINVPTEKLLSPDYIKSRRKEVSIFAARKADQVQAGKIPDPEHTETTHISIMDSEGNAVSTTQTINGWMGAGVVVPGTGIILNNEMDDFSALPGSSNLYGAIGGEANAIEPQKTPLSSMSPTILVKKEKPVLSIGAPGGTRIISCVAQTILNYTEFGLSLKESISLVRYHHQWKPDVLTIDPPGPSVEALKQLKTLGYEVELKPVPCFVMAVAKEGNTLKAVADPRDIGTSGAQ